MPADLESQGPFLSKATLRWRARDSELRAQAVLPVHAATATRLTGLAHQAYAQHPIKRAQCVQNQHGGFEHDRLLQRTLMLLPFNTPVCDLGHGLVWAMSLRVRTGESRRLRARLGA